MQVDPRRLRSALRRRKGAPMHIKIKLLLILAALVLAPSRVLAQETTYNCPNPLPARHVCIDSITAVPGNAALGGGVSIVVHWIASFSPDSFQIRYAFPGSPDTQVNLSAGNASEGVYNLPLSATAVGGYTFKVQGCVNQVLAPAACYGGNQPPWDVEVFNYTPATSTTSSGLTASCPSSRAAPNGTCCAPNNFALKNNTCCPISQVPSLLTLTGNLICCPAGDNVGPTLCCPAGQHQVDKSCVKVTTIVPIVQPKSNIPLPQQTTVPIVQPKINIQPQKQTAPIVTPAACDPKQKTPNGNCCASGTVPQRDNSCCPSGQMTGNHICCPEGQSAGTTMCCPAGQHQAGKICTAIGTQPPPKKGTGSKS
jgi:hypothetical protein